MLLQMSVGKLICEPCNNVQTAADLQWLAGDPANDGVRGEFLLGIFSSDHGGNNTPQTLGK
jgi:hypothetical protein